jgi:hypothetical protein
MTSTGTIARLQAASCSGVNPTTMQRNIETPSIVREPIERAIGSE